MATAAAETKPRRMFMPYDPDAAATPRPVPGLDGLSDDEVFNILTDPKAFERHTGRPPETWYTARFAAESGRSHGRFKVWISNFYKVKKGADPATIEDRIMVKPDGYDVRSPWWLETTANRWLIQEKLKTRRGVRVAHKPSGKPKGRTDRVPRRRSAPMKAVALDVLDVYERLVAAGTSMADAKQKVAASNGLTVRKVARRLSAGRTMRAAGVRKITPEMAPAQVRDTAVTLYRVLMADGRRKHEENARAAVAEQLGLDRATVDAAVDALERKPLAART